MLALFTIESVILIIIDYRINHRLISALSLIIIPYIFVFNINNVFMTKNGFFQISDENIAWHMLSFFLLFIGTSLSKIISFKGISLKTQPEYVDKSYRYKLSSIVKYVLFVEIIVAVRVAMIVLRNGFSYIASGENGEGIFATGIVGHLYLSIFPLAPILFLNWIKNKKGNSIYLFLYLVQLGFTFLTFTKYHTISLIMLTFLLCVLEDTKYLIKGTVSLAIIILLAFVGNYLVSFIVRNVASQVTRQFYYNHFWSYVGGSSIHANAVFSGSIVYKSDLFGKLLACILPIPNMFTQGIFGVRILPDTSTTFMSIGMNNSTSNVVDAVSFFYPSSGSWLDIVVYLFFFIFWGWMLSLVYDKTVGREDKYPLAAVTLLTFSAFLAFFGVYAVLSSPWEILLWSVLFNFLFDKKVKIKFTSI